MIVKDVMTRDPITIDPDAPVATAVATMREREVRHLPVVDDTGRLVGMVTDRDLRGALLAPAIAEFLSPPARRRQRAMTESIQALRVRDVMTWNAITTEPQAAVAQAAAVMLEGRFGSLPVVEDGILVGIVTERDVLRALAATLPAVRGIDPDAFFW